MPTVENELRANHYDNSSIEKFDKQNVKELCRDYNTGKNQMICFNSMATFIQPIDLTSEWSINHDIVEFDFYENENDKEFHSPLIKILAHFHFSLWSLLIFHLIQSNILDYKINAILIY